MKVNDSFYETANAKIKQIIEKLEEDIEQFKTIGDSILTENNFGFASIAVHVMNDDMYLVMSGKLEGLVSNITSCTESFVEAINGDDVLY